MHDKQKTRGKLLIIEGADHCGKTTIIENLKKYLASNYRNKEFVFTREPGGMNDPITEKIRDVLLDKDNKIYPLTEAYLYAASRAQHNILIEEKLSQGINVICDRHIFSSLVYQGICRNLGIKEVMEINNQAMQPINFNSEDGIYIIYLKIDFDTYKKRKGKPEKLDRLELEGDDFFKNILAGYDKIAEITDACITVDANKSKKEVLDKVKKQIDKIFKEV